MDKALLLLSSLAIGLLLGMDRERSPGRRAGLRTFALVALLGTLCSWLAQTHQQGLIVAAGLLMVGVMMVSAYHGAAADPGTTTTAALLLCFTLGAMVGGGQVYWAAVIALAAAALLHFKAELHGAIGRMSEEDLRAMLQFAVIAFVILPILPDHGYGPYGALNPHRIWWMVVLVSGLSLAAYAALRIAGHRMGIPVMAMLGGAVSSTGTTMVISRQLRGGRINPDVGALVILGANLVVMLRLGLIAAAVSPQVLPQLLPIFAVGLIAGMAVPLHRWGRVRHLDEKPSLDLSNPAELPLALGSGALFSFVLLSAAWLHHQAGTGAVYAMAAIMGLPDLDAVVLSILQLLKLGELQAQQAVNAVLIAYLSNMSFKLALLGLLGGRSRLAMVASGFVSVAAALLVARLLLN